MALSDILSAIGTLLTGAGAQNVYGYRPLLTQGAAITADLKYQGTIHFWGITRSATAERRLTSFETQRNHTIDIHGYLEVGDAATTEPAFQGLVEAIMEDLRATYRLTGAANVELLGAPQAEGMEAPRLLADMYLVHYVHLSVDAQQLVSP